MALNLPKDSSGNVKVNVAAGSTVNLTYNTTPPAPTNGATVVPQSDSAGSLLVSTEGRKTTYTAATGVVTGVAGLWFLVIGSASKTLKITSVEVSVRNSSASNIFAELSFVILSSLPTGGTSAGATNGPLDLNDAATTANPIIYSVAPTGGVIATYIELFDFLAVSSTAGTAPIFSNKWVYGNGQPGAKLPTIRGTGQAFAIQSATPGLSVSGVITWTEE